MSRRKIAWHQAHHFDARLRSEGGERKQRRREVTSGNSHAS
jgi:hypothetical protein